MKETLDQNPLLPTIDGPLRGSETSSSDGHARRSFEIGQVLGENYRIERALASGSMGTVFEAHDIKEGRAVALKVLFPHVALAVGGAERFRREVKAGSVIKHPGAVEIYDAGTENGVMFYAMELLDGMTLEAWLDTRPQLIEALEAVARVLEPLAEAHALGIVHRDIKPENIFIQPAAAAEHRVKLLDFGIARDAEAVAATQTGHTLGTPLYMSPDQAMNPRGVEPSADVWSVGALLYEIITGRPPFIGTSSTAILIQAIQEPHAPLGDDVDEELRALIDDCLEKNPVDRPQSATALLGRLDKILCRVRPKRSSRLTIPSPDHAARSLTPAGHNGAVERRQRALRRAAVLLSVIAVILCGALWYVAVDETEVDGAGNVSVAQPVTQNVEVASVAEVPPAPPEIEPSPLERGAAERSAVERSEATLERAVMTGEAVVDGIQSARRAARRPIEREPAPVARVAEKVEDNQAEVPAPSAPSDGLDVAATLEPAAASSHPLAVNDLAPVAPRETEDDASKEVAAVASPAPVPARVAKGAPLEAPVAHKEAPPVQEERKKERDVAPDFVTF